MTAELSAPPVLSTPAEHTFLEDPTPSSAVAEAQAKRSDRSDNELYDVYEIARTVEEIRRRGWGRTALQFPDAMLPDAPWVVERLSRELEQVDLEDRTEDGEEGQQIRQRQEEDMMYKGTSEDTRSKRKRKRRLYVLADTSYSACCVDEIAAEHADADAVVHYGRACLSPTARLPVLHIFTEQKLNYDAVAEAFEQEFPDKSDKIILMADVMFQVHVIPLWDLLKNTKAYANVVATEIVHDPSSIIPNRRLLSELDNEERDLRTHHLFHISTPPTSLLLTLSSRLASLRIFPTPSSPYTTTTTSSSSSSTAASPPDPSATASLLRRRYALVVGLATASIIGILVNTLSVKNYMSTIATLRTRIAAAHKKSYTVVVGKLNAAKLANFAEVDGWVVVGCWESGLVEQHEALWRPVVTPFELALALVGDGERVWTGDWWGGIEGVAAQNGEGEKGDEQQLGDSSVVTQRAREHADTRDSLEREGGGEEEGGVDDEESEPPEFDLRTGKLVTASRPMRKALRSAAAVAASTPPTTDAADADDVAPRASTALTKRAAAGEVALVNGILSPGADFLRSKRTWQGLGTDFGFGNGAVADEGGGEEEEGEEKENSTVVEQGRSGVARGYTVGEEEDQRRT